MLTEPQTLAGALMAAIAALTAAVVHLYRENQKLHLAEKQSQAQHHKESQESQAQMLRVLSVTEKALESFSKDSELIKESVLLMKDRQASILKTISASSSEKSQRNLPR